MAKKDAQTLPHIRYANVDVFVEEAIRIENHRPAIVVVWTKGRKALMRIIPSKKWIDNENIEQNLSGLISHETLHIWLSRVLGQRVTKKLDKLPKPNTWEDYITGIWGWGLGGAVESKSA